jgi:hypothetical protein
VAVAAAVKVCKTETIAGSPPQEREPFPLNSAKISDTAETISEPNTAGAVEIGSRVACGAVGGCV